ncbi:regulator of G-protein signaling 10 isoform X1 [Zootoca vivipara]|uniref:regulator of G-protein signaling 10 isoform X1 n=1 Tax=Zootoca vivipara TaxID=8524 RepID=UPI00293C0C60|nr:regulator of G-protein signaling 10 isoform X1 [Zootoca vivipara]
MFTRAVSRLSRKRPPSEINDSDSKPSSSHQSLNGTTRWATSLEQLLEDPEGVKRFREFLKKEFSEENVLFWLACEEFKKIKDEKQMQAKANEIYMTFLSSKASFQVNVEGQSRLDESILEKPHPLMFQRLQDQLFYRVQRQNCVFKKTRNPLFTSYVSPPCFKCDHTPLQQVLKKSPPMLSYFICCPSLTCN